MDRKQKQFLAIIALLAALILLIAAITRLLSDRAIPETVTPVIPGGTSTPTPRTTLTPRGKTPTPEKSPTIEPGPTGTETRVTTEAPGEFFVAVDGDKNNDGSEQSPWPLQYALNHPSRVSPGDTIWVRGGEYVGEFTLRLEGEKDQPITLRAYPGERAILMNDDLVLDISTSQYVNVWGLEITATENTRDPENRPESAYGIRINQGRTSHHIKFINMIIHDMAAQGFGWWRANSDSELYGSLIYYNGVNQFDHGVYVMNDRGEKRIVDNMIFDNASHGIHAYGEKEEQKLDNLYLEGNTVFNNGSIGYGTRSGVYGKYQRNILVGGRLVANHPVIRENYTYYPDLTGEALNLGYRAGSSEAMVEENYLVGGTITLGGENTGITMKGNTISGLGLTSVMNMGLGANDWMVIQPREAKVFVRPNKYEEGRANITIYNWQRADQIVLSSKDLAGVKIKKGDRYELHNVQDYFGDVISGVYDGSGIEIPMTGHTVAQPLGLSFKPASTFPDFGAFVLITTGK